MHILIAHTISRENSSNSPIALLSGSQINLFGQRKILFGFPSEKQALKRGDGSTRVQGWTIKITTGKICVSVRPLNLSVVNWKITESLSGATIKPFFLGALTKYQWRRWPSMTQWSSAITATTADAQSLWRPPTRRSRWEKMSLMSAAWLHTRAVGWFTTVARKATLMKGSRQSLTGFASSRAIGDR